MSSRYGKDVVVVQGSSRPASVYSYDSNASRTNSSYTNSSSSYYSSSSTMNSSSGAGSSSRSASYYYNEYRDPSAGPEAGYKVKVTSTKDRNGKPVTTINHGKKYSDPAEDRSRGYVISGSRDQKYV